MRKLVFAACLILLFCSLFLVSCGAAMDFEFKTPMYTDGQVVLTPTEDASAYTCTGLVDNTSVGVLMIPDYFWGKPVVAIGRHAFPNGRGIQRVILGGNIRTIGENAFLYGEVTSLEGACPLELIDSSAFAGSGLVSVSLYNVNDLVIEDYAFASCSSLKSVVISGSMTSIGDSAFRDCVLLSTIILPNGLREIGSSAFRSCSSLTDLRLPDRLESIGDRAFASTSINSTEIPASVTSVGSYIFDDIQGPVTVTVAWEEGDKPEGWSSIWNHGDNVTVIYGGGEEEVL